MAATFIASLAQGAETNGPVVIIPKGVVAATQQQKDFLKNIAALSPGASRDAVLKAVGKPVDTNSATWFYELNEGPEGGYYVIAFVTFGPNGLSKARVDHGHKTMSRKDSE